MILESHYELQGEEDDFLYKVVYVIFTTNGDIGKDHFGHRVCVLNFSEHGFT